jgi:hypothetical protein
MMKEWQKKESLPPSCLEFYSFGGMTRSCLSALRGALTLEIGATDFSNTKPISRKQDPEICDLSYDSWIKMLWENLPKSSRFDDVGNKDAIARW